MKNKLLFIWDLSRNNISVLMEEFRTGPLFHNYDYFGNDQEIDIICSEKDLLEQKLLTETEKLYSYNAIFIKEELIRKNWNGETGINLLIKIRKTKYLNPIFYYSNNSKSELYKRNKHRILKTPSHYHVNSAFVIDLKSADKPQKLTPELLEEILYYTINNKGITEELLHNLKNKLPFIKDWDRNRKDEYLSIIEYNRNEIQTVVPKHNLFDFNSIFDKIANELTNTKLSPSSLVYSKKDELLLLFDKEKETTIVQKFDWQVLFIDDEKPVRELVSSSFQSRGLVCHTASTAQEAFQILESDIQGELKNAQKKALPSNTITVVIADWRLQNDDGEWNNLQGYDIINHIHRQMYNVVSFFVLTSKKGVIVNQAKKDNSIRISWHSKEDVLDSESSFNLFFDQVVSDGENTYDVLCGKPKTTSWRKASKNIVVPLKDYYRVYRNLGNYHNIEAEINQDVMYYLEEVEDNYPEKTGDERAPDIEIDPSLIHFNTKFKSKIDGPPTGLVDDNMEKFITKLKGRRIALALSSENFSFSSDQIINLLKYGNTNPSDEEIFKTMSKKMVDEIDRDGRSIPEEKQLLPTHLNLSKKIEKDIPFFILPEEIKFLEGELGFPIINRKDREKFYKVNKQIASICEEIYKSNPDKYYNDDFLVNPRKVFSEVALKRIIEILFSKYGNRTIEI